MIHNTTPPAGIAELLALLGLPPALLGTLTHQGFVAAEFRRRGGRTFGPYYKLRYRQDGRQRVHYLGRDAARARALQEALLRLQAPRQQARDLGGCMRGARAKAKQMKAAIEPLLGADEYFHGYRVRQRRATPPSPAVCVTEPDPFSDALVSVLERPGDNSCLPINLC